MSISFLFCKYAYIKTGALPLSCPSLMTSDGWLVFFQAKIKYAKQTIGVYIISICPEVKSVIQFCCALPLLPPHLLQRGLNAIGTEALNLGDPVFYEVVRPFLTYVQHEWLDHINRGQCISVCLSEHRTNNAR